MRIQKWLSHLGIASRREAEQWIQAKRISLNGQIATLGTKIDPERDQLAIDGKVVANKIPPRVYWMLHKPTGYLTSRVGEANQPTIYDLPKLSQLPFLVSPIGRLDFMTEGLLLLSNDGELVSRLSHPRYHVPRHYQALINRRLEPEEEAQVRAGIQLDSDPPPKVEIQHAHKEKLGATHGNWYFVTVFEGRNRLVRRLFESFGCRVIRLIRTGFGDLTLPEDLQPGTYRQLTAEEIDSLRRYAKLTGSPTEEEL